jgi:hypothetical protein
MKDGSLPVPPTAQQNLESTTPAPDHKPGVAAHSSEPGLGAIVGASAGATLTVLLAMLSVCLWVRRKQRGMSSDKVVPVTSQQPHAIGARSSPTLHVSTPDEPLRSTGYPITDMSKRSQKDADPQAASQTDAARMILGTNKQGTDILTGFSPESLMDTDADTIYESIFGTGAGHSAPAMCTPPVTATASSPGYAENEAELVSMMCTPAVDQNMDILTEALMDASLDTIYASVFGSVERSETEGLLVCKPLDLVCAPGPAMVTASSQQRERNESFSGQMSCVAGVTSMRETGADLYASGCSSAVAHSYGGPLASSQVTAAMDAASSDCDCEMCMLSRGQPVGAQAFAAAGAELPSSIVQDDITVMDLDSILDRVYESGFGRAQRANREFVTPCVMPAAEV